MWESEKYALGLPFSGELKLVVMAGLTKIMFLADVAQQRRELRGLNDHMLKDLGLSRSDAEREASRSFWDIRILQNRRSDVDIRKRQTPNSRSRLLIKLDDWHRNVPCVDLFTNYGCPLLAHSGLFCALPGMSANDPTRTFDEKNGRKKGLIHEPHRQRSLDCDAIVK